MRIWGVQKFSEANFLFSSLETLECGSFVISKCRAVKVEKA